MQLPDASHRAYPPPAGSWVMRMTWRDLLFMHWEVDAAALRRAVPACLPLDLYEGRAFVGVVPFEMTATRLRGAPPVCGTSRFAELNVRTYVTLGGRPGVWFFSLDAASPLAVGIARLTYRLPYFNARMAIEHEADGAIGYRSTRTQRGAPPARFAARYRPTGPSYRAEPGSLDAFLTERYCLYTVDRRGRPLRGEVHHAPWPLRPAVCEAEAMDMMRIAGLTLPEVPPLLHFAEALDVVAWRIGRA